MTINAGVWIDHHKAVLVHLNEDGEKLRQIDSDQHPSAESADVVRVKNSYTPNDFTAEDHRERKAMNHLHKFYDEVIAALHDADAILVMGPGEAKGEFVKRLESHRHQGPDVEVKTTDKMTDHQIAATVREHFSQANSKSH